MVSSPLLEDYTVKLLDESKIPTFIPKDPISRYNYVIDAYNNESNRIDNTILPQMPICEVLLIILMIFLPFINVITFILILWAFIYYMKFLIHFRRNEKIVDDPFKNMIYSPEMCDSIHKINWFFEIQFEDLQGLILNLDTIDFLRTRNKEGKVAFMIYNNVFWDFYHEVQQKKNIHLLWLIFSIFLLIISGSVFYMYYYIIVHVK